MCGGRVVLDNTTLGYSLSLARFHKRWLGAANRQVLSWLLWLLSSYRFYWSTLSWFYRSMLSSLDWNMLTRLDRSVLTWL